MIPIREGMMMTRRIPLLALLALLLLMAIFACNRGNSTDGGPQMRSRPYPPEPFPIGNEIIERPAAASDESRSAPNPARNAYFGDLHVHTTWSMDAFAFGTTVTPRDAYRYARGEAIPHPAGFEMQLREPLDFYAITDHALFLGLAAEAADTSTDFSKLEVARPMHDLNVEGNKGVLSILKRLRLFSDFIPAVLEGLLDGSIDPELPRQVTKTAWLDTIEAADEFNEPGAFSTFVAFEFTPSATDGGSLHRNVFFRGSARVPAEPFSRYNSRNPEGLWDWMDGLRAQGIEALAIPHNSNASNGQMFKLADWARDPLDNDYAERRIRNEPLVEITQVKGTSETLPALSDTDEWANFEIKPFVGSSLEISEPRGSYVRSALRDGIAFEEAGIVNPFQFGFIAASDTHVGATTDDESNFHSKVGLLDATPELRGSTPLPWWQAQPLKWLRPQLVQEIEGRSYSRTPTRTFGASGLAAVWAEENTRESIYQAFRRKETFATSGPRIRVRFFAGHDLDPSLLDDRQAIRRAYANGVPMGGDLPRGGADSPGFFTYAMRDAQSAPLQRLQIVKGWSANGETFEKVYDVACSDGGKPDSKAHRCPDNGARVDLDDCSVTQGVGAGQLSALWRDPDFDPDQRAFYYVRALENPTCRWSSWDALRSGVEPRPDLHATLQERAWSSPIWYAP
jgi:hypothetical protein